MRQFPSREVHSRDGGPDGGDGGNGGSVVVVAEAGVDSLAVLAHRKHWRARNGVPGGASNCHGKNAEDLIIRVPPGTLVRDAEHDLVLRDLSHVGDQVVAARGGKGGKGNARFKSANQPSAKRIHPRR